MPHWRDLIPSRLLRAEQIEGDLVLTVTKVVKEELKKKDETEEIRGVLYFKEIDKGLAVNVTNSMTIEAVTGEADWEKWVGKTITLYATTCSAFGNPKTPCIRVRD